MSRRTGFLVAAVVFFGAVGLAVLLVSLAPEAERREPPVDVPFVQIANAVAGSGAIPVYGAGTVRPSAEIDMAAQVEGRVVWVNPVFRSGKRLQAGELVFRIEEDDYVHRLREAEAALSARQSEYLLAREEAAIARDEYERYTNRQADADAQTDASPLTLREPQLRAAKAALDRDKARVAGAELLLSRTRVSAPFDGIVRDESLEVGELVRPGQIVGRLIAANAVEVVVPLTDADAALIPGLWANQEGDAEDRAPARVVAHYGDVRYAWVGAVDRAEAALGEQTRTINVVVRVSDPFLPGAASGSGLSPGTHPLPLLVGKFVEVEIQGLAPARYVRMPRSALQPGNQVWAVDDGRVRIVPVRVLQRGDDEVFVTADLEQGQAIVVGGIRFATDGMRVRSGPAPGQ